MSKRRAALFFTLLLAPARLPAQETPRVANERVILHTNAGDIVLALYPDVAPRHVAQILKLARLGAYDTTRFLRVIPGFLVQLADAADRVVPMNKAQASAIHPLKAEFSRLHHRTGVLSMSRENKDPDSALTSFSIMLADWPGGDGGYTIFGRVQEGMDVVAEFLKVPRDYDDQPLTRLEVRSAEVATSAELARRTLAAARPVMIPPDETRPGIGRPKALAAALAVMALLLLAARAASIRFPRAAPAMKRINVLVGVVFIMTVLLPSVHLIRAISIALILGILDVSAAKRASAAPAVLNEKILGWLIVVLSLTVYGFSLDFPDFAYFDELNYLPILRRLWNPSGFALATHPPLGYILSSFSIDVFGNQAWAWRLPSLFSGLGLIWIVYRMTKILTGRPRAAFLACVVFSMDGICFVQSRIFTLNAVMLFFGLLSLLCFMEHACADAWTRRPAFFLSGLLLGCSFATRWQSVSLLALYALLYLELLRKSPDMRDLCLDALLFWAGPCAAVYLAVCWWIFSRSAHGILPILGSIMEWHHRIYLFQMNVGDNHPYASRWWTWPIMARPVWYIFRETAPGVIRGILCIGNPAVIWTLPTAASYMAWLSLHRDRAVRGPAVFILAGFASQWLPWAFRPGMEFIHYFYTAVPFLAMAVGLGLDRLWRSDPRGRWFVACFLGIIAIMFAYWYPLLSGIPISKAAYYQRMWLPSWI